MREKMMAKFACDDRIELMNAQKRRMKQLQHKREVEQLLADRRQRLANERERAQSEAAKDRDWQRLIANETKKQDHCFETSLQKIVSLFRSNDSKILILVSRNKKQKK